MIKAILRNSRKNKRWTTQQQKEEQNEVDVYMCHNPQNALLK